MKITKKWMLSGGSILLILISGYCWWINYGPYDITTPEKEIGGPKEYERFMNSLKSAYENDTVGFATPEETFDAFREALKGGDYELAASYFVPEKQEEMLNEFKIGTENGAVVELLKYLYLSNTIKKINDSNIRIIVKDGEYIFGYELVFNKYNNIWKMYEL